MVSEAGLVGTVDTWNSYIQAVWPGVHILQVCERSWKSGVVLCSVLRFKTLVMKSDESTKQMDRHGRPLKQTCRRGKDGLLIWAFVLWK